ncbi:hypothetical protein TRVA0_012S00848 [Trichomonascus vanleenenianus]|uniref:uncharacterized protein n=1 Tax=Trichomonascus vanleenenianus TaxID=2268995 RepID=UPI003EC96285
MGDSKTPAKGHSSASFDLNSPVLPRSRSGKSKRGSPHDIHSPIDVKRSKKASSREAHAADIHTPVAMVSGTKPLTTVLDLSTPLTKKPRIDESSETPWSPSPKKKVTFYRKDGLAEQVQSLVLHQGLKFNLAKTISDNRTALVVDKVSKWNRHSFHVHFTNSESGVLIDDKNRRIKLSPGDKIALGDPYLCLAPDIYFDWSIVK